jgi:membrane-associated HD superfamily phosphohydrolase
MINIDLPKISPLTILLLFQLIYISHSFYGELTMKVRYQLENNKLLRHGLIFLMVLVVVSELYKNYDLKIILLYSVILYILLVALTRISAQWFIGIFIILCILFIYRSQVDKKINVILDNPLVDYGKKETLNNKDNKNRLIQFGLVIGLIITGVLFYEKHKMNKHQGQFRLIKFIFNK